MSQYSHLLALEQIREEITNSELECQGLRSRRLSLIESALEGGCGPGEVARALRISAQRLQQLRKAEV